LTNLTTTVFVVLLTLKIAGALEITWFWVFFPLWIGWFIAIMFFAFMVLIGMLAALLEDFL